MAKMQSVFFLFFVFPQLMVTFGSYEDRIDNLPGQPHDAPILNQYGGYITVDETEGRSLFYYFVEALEEPYSKPLLLWLGEGRGCSSLVGAMTGIGPFGVNPDGYTLYTRNITWNKVVNILFLEAPVGVGFSYSNTFFDQHQEYLDILIATDSYFFLTNWFERFPEYKNRDLYIAGEGYSGYHIPRLAHAILKRNMEAASVNIALQGIMIGNGFLNTEIDNRGRYHFIWSHALISDDAYENLTGNCTGPCVSENSDIGMVNPIDIYGPMCGVPSAFQRAYDPCEVEYLEAYLNIPNVQYAINANKTKLPHTWEICSSRVFQNWSSPTTMFPIYKDLIASNLKILLYSGDTDTVVPVTSTRYSLYAMGLKVLKPWIPWNGEMDEVAGYQVVYEGLTFATVRGAGHSIPRMQSARAFALLKRFLIKK